jgi:hypothetical protein
LSHVLSTAAVIAKPVREVDQRPLPATNDALEGRDLPRQDSFDSGLIFARAQAKNPFGEYDPIPSLPVAFLLSGISEENATENVEDLSHLMQRNNRAEEIDMFSLPMALFLSVAAVAVFSFVAVAVWSDNRRKEREAYYRSEALKKMVEAQGTGASSAVELLRQEEKIAARRRLEGQKLGGIITLAVGVGLMIFLKAVDHNEPAFLVGIIPLLVGAALLAYSHVLAPKN